jgi:shikimate kinase
LDSIILIGMPGSGKSTVGVLLAKELRKEFVDTDLLIQTETGRGLQEILDQDGIPGFLALEESVVLGFRPRRMVVATGGSVVYSRPAMDHLSSHGICVYLECSVSALEDRLSNLHSRGVVRAPGQSVEALFRERDPLYRAWARMVVDNGHDDHAGVVEEIARLLRARSA